MTGEYEGGFKVWESTRDLLHLLGLGREFDHNRLDGKNVLDLGCGSGILGVACLILSPSATVTFHDYNEEVVDYFTLANILLNLKNQGMAVQEVKRQVSSRVTLSSGDWSNFHPSESFDLILSSETIYNQDYYPKLVSVIERCLSPSLGEKKENLNNVNKEATNAVALIAAKTYYFGVGGGTRSLKTLSLNPHPNCNRL